MSKAKENGAAQAFPGPDTDTHPTGLSKREHLAKLAPRMLEMLERGVAAIPCCCFTRSAKVCWHHHAKSLLIEARGGESDV